jgi:hypothetical protein
MPELSQPYYTFVDTNEGLEVMSKAHDLWAEGLEDEAVDLVLESLEDFGYDWENEQQTVDLTETIIAGLT